MAIYKSNGQWTGYSNVKVGETTWSISTRRVDYAIRSVAQKMTDNGAGMLSHSVFAPESDTIQLSAIDKQATKAAITQAHNSAILEFNLSQLNTRKQ